MAGNRKPSSIPSAETIKGIAKLHLSLLPGKIDFPFGITFVSCVPDQAIA